MPIFPRRVADINKVTFTGSFRSQNGGVVGEIIWMDFLGVSIVWPGKGRGVGCMGSTFEGVVVL
jgi:hypothetical protein